MRKLSLSLLLMLAITGAYAQSKENVKKSSTLVIQVGAFDFATPQKIRSTSLGTVLSNDQWAKLSEQNFSMGISYMKGLNDYFDLSANYYLTSVDYPFRDGTEQYGTDYLLH